MSAGLMSAPESTTDSGGGTVYSVRDVSKIFPDSSGRPFVALDSVSLEVHQSEFLCLVGPSGCGKSTLLNLLAGLDSPTSGEIDRQKGRSKDPDKQPTRASSVGYMTQSDALLPWRTVYDNVALGLELGGFDKRLRGDMVTEALDKVGLLQFRDAYPAQLSGGMRKRVGLARSLVYGPSVLLMDEPFGALDAQLKFVLREQLLTLWESLRVTVVFVTHDLDEALLLGDRIAVFASNPGRMIAVDEVGFERPRNAHELRARPDFWEHWDRLWNLLSPEDPTKKQRVQ